MKQDLETLLQKLHDHWHDCLWIDASDLMVLEKVIEMLEGDK